MSAYESDPRVEKVNQSFLVDRKWWVAETGQQWDAWPWPQCEEPDFDEQQYMVERLRGKATFTADEKIRELIGGPR